MTIYWDQSWTERIGVGGCCKKAYFLYDYGRDAFKVSNYI